jgi:hypothetical protein
MIKVSEYSIRARPLCTGGSMYLSQAVVKSLLKTGSRSLANSDNFGDCLNTSVNKHQLLHIRILYHFIMIYMTSIIHPYKCYNQPENVLT